MWPCQMEQTKKPGYPAARLRSWNFLWIYETGCYSHKTMGRMVFTRLNQQHPLSKCRPEQDHRYHLTRCRRQRRWSLIWSPVKPRVHVSLEITIRLKRGIRGWSLREIDTITKNSHGATRIEVIRQGTRTIYHDNWTRGLSKGIRGWCALHTRGIVPQVFADVTDLSEHISPAKWPVKFWPVRVSTFATSLLGILVVEIPGL